MNCTTTSALLMLAIVTNDLSSTDSSVPAERVLAQAERNDKPGSDSKAVQEYWTPERLRNAKPMELPHPDRPIEGNGHAGRDSSVSGSGSPGSGTVPPDRGNLLVAPGKADRK